MIRPPAGLLLALFAAAAGAQTQVYIGVSASGEARFAVGLPPFSVPNGTPGAADAARRLHDVVRDDLLFSRRFTVVEPPSAAAAANPNAGSEEWKKAGAAFVLGGALSAAEPKLSLQAFLLDLGSGENILERYYRQDSAYWRSAAHQIADDVVRQLTGRPGIAHTQIAFVDDRTGHKEIYVMDYDGANLRQLTHDESIDLLPRWSPDRRRLLYTGYGEGNPDLYELDMEKGTSRVLLDVQGLNIAGGFSPDGSRLVLTQSRGKNPNIFLLTFADRSLRQITDHFGVDTSPTFSPDGRQVAFVSDRSGNPQVHLLDLQTRKVTRLTRLNWCDTPSWSPTGEWIAFAGRANPLDPMDIFLVDLTGEHVRQLTHGEGTNEDPQWAPDGRFLVFTSTRGGRRRVYIMDSDGSAPHAVGEIGGDAYTPAWSP